MCIRDSSNNITVLSSTLQVNSYSFTISGNFSDTVHDVNKHLRGIKTVMTLYANLEVRMQIGSTQIATTDNSVLTIFNQNQE